MEQATSQNKTVIERITTLAEHRRLLTRVFETAQERVIVVSPFISSSAIKADGVHSLARSATRRGVDVSVYTDDMLNTTENGAVKESAAIGIRSMADSGATVHILSGIHHKTLIRDNDLITEGSFNWLSAVRSKGAVHQREERTMVIEGPEATELISKETDTIRSLSRTAAYSHEACEPLPPTRKHERDTVMEQDTDKKYGKKGVLGILFTIATIAGASYYLKTVDWATSGTTVQNTQHARGDEDVWLLVVIGAVFFGFMVFALIKSAQNSKKEDRPVNNDEQSLMTGPYPYDYTDAENRWV